MIPPRFFVLVRELRFGGSANFKISTLYVLCAVCSGVDHGGQRVNPSTHLGVSQARSSAFALGQAPRSPLALATSPQPTADQRSVLLGMLAQTQQISSSKAA